METTKNKIAVKLNSDYEIADRVGMRVVVVDFETWKRLWESIDAEIEMDLMAEIKMAIVGEVS